MVMAFQRLRYHAAALDVRLLDIPGFQPRRGEIALTVFSRRIASLELAAKEILLGRTGRRRRRFAGRGSSSIGADFSRRIFIPHEIASQHYGRDCRRHRFWSARSAPPSSAPANRVCRVQKPGYLPRSAVKLLGSYYVEGFAAKMRDICAVSQLRRLM